MPELRNSPPPVTHVLVKTAYDSAHERRPWYWVRESWLNDPVIGAHPPDFTVKGTARYATRRAAMVAGLLAAAREA